MSEFENTQNIIEWDDTHFFIVDSQTLKVIRQDELFGWQDQQGWEEARLDGPIADVRRLQEKWRSYDFGLGSIDTIAMMERMLQRSRALFIRPLVELEAYARDYQRSKNDEALL